MFQDDWYMRQIEMMIDFIRKVVFKDERLEYKIKDESQFTYTDNVFSQILYLLSENKICEAEDLLYDKMELSFDYLKLCMDFYNRLNKLSDETLNNNNFSRREIEEGIKDISNTFGIDYIENI